MFTFLMKVPAETLKEFAIGLKHAYGGYMDGRPSLLSLRDAVHSAASDVRNDYDASTRGCLSALWDAAGYSLASGNRPRE
jgi:hypothetical protein